MNLLQESQRKLNLIQNKDRKDIQDTLFFNPIKIDDEYGLQDSDQFEDLKLTEDIIPKTSTILKSADFMVHMLDDTENTQNNSAYSFGDGDKLYQKLDRLIQILIQNCFKKKLKKQSNKLQTQISRKLSKRLSATNEELIFDFQTSSKEIFDPYNSFKIGSIGKTPK